jgi:hypothetical protein
MRNGQTLAIIEADRPSASERTKPSNNSTVYDRPPGIPSDGEGVCFSHLTLTAGSTDKPGLSRPAALKSWFCKWSKSMRTGTRCLPRRLPAELEGMTSRTEPVAPPRLVTCPFHERP